MFWVRKSCAQSTLLVFVNFVRPVYSLYSPQRTFTKSLYTQITHAATNGQCFFSPVHSFIFIYYFFFVFFPRQSAHHIGVECVSVERVVKLLGNIFRIMTLCSVCMHRLSHTMIGRMFNLLASNFYFPLSVPLLPHLRRCLQKKKERRNQIVII